jgi:alkylated DNA repair protein (DNA oxidative demethylase)
MLEISSGIRHFPGYLDRPAQETMIETIRQIVSAASAAIAISRSIR